MAANASQYGRQSDILCLLDGSTYHHLGSVFCQEMDPELDQVSRLNYQEIQRNTLNDTI